MAFGTYRQIMGVRDARTALLTGLIIRIPMWASGVIITLHVVTHLHRSYADAGLVAAVATVAASISGPWRGRRLDRIGLRPTVAPSLVLLTGCWSVAPFVGYWALLPLAFLGGLFIVPTFSIVRTVLINAVDESQRRTALALDSVGVEISFMIGPAMGVFAATAFDTRFALLGAELLSVVGGVALWLLNPPLDSRAEVHEQIGVPISVRSWLSPAAVGVLLTTAAATVILSGSDVGAVAALRAMHHQTSLTWVLLLWGLGSAIGGMTYGALSRQPPSWILLSLLGLTTIPIALAGNRVVFGILLFCSGLFCAPTITATVDQLSRLVPQRVLAEAMGWHGSALTVGNAFGAPVIGVVIDSGGWSAGFVAAGLLGLLVVAAAVSVQTFAAKPA